MQQPLTLKQIERKAWRTVFHDGLWDLYLGLLLMAMAVSAWLSDSGVPMSAHSAVYLGLVILSMAALWAGKRFITVPRMGRMKLGPQARKRRNKARLILALSVILGLVVFLTTLAARDNRPPWFDARAFLPAAWIVNSLLVFGLAAYFLQYERLYFVGLMYAIAIPADFLLRRLTGLDLSPIAIGLPALAILVVGAAVLLRFLRDYPPLPLDATGGSR